jgi:hypothetical protein
MADPIPGAAVPQREAAPAVALGASGALAGGIAAAARNPLVAFAAVYCAVRVLGFLEVDPRVFPDTGVYDKVAAAPLLSESFLAGGRPPTVPLAYKLLGGESARVAAQLLLSIACWTGLAAAVATSLRDPLLRVAGFAAVLAFSLSHEIVLWDADLLSESVAISLTAALIAAWLLVIRRPAGWSVALMVVTSAAWALSRDPHAYLLVAVALALAATLLVARDGARLRITAVVALLAIAAASLVSASTGYPRWLLPVQNLVTLRISDDPEGLRHFERAGMPVSARFTELSEQHRETGVRPFEHPGELYYGRVPEERFMPFQLWLADHGRGTYAHYLLTHPGAVAAGIGPSLDALLDPGVERYGASVGPAELPVVSALAYAGGPWLMAAWLLIAVALAAVAAIRAGPRREWAVPLFLIAASAPFALFVYHAGAQELDRHELIPSILLRLGALLLALMAVDALARRRRLAAR